MFFSRKIGKLFLYVILFHALLYSVWKVSDDLIQAPSTRLIKVPIGTLQKQELNQLVDWTRSTRCAQYSPMEKDPRVDALMVRKNMTIEQAFQELMSKYVKWHSGIRRRGKLGCTRVLVWTCGSGAGLGNQVRGALHALILAMETHRYFVMDPYSKSAIRQMSSSSIIWERPNGVKHGNITVVDYYAVSKIEAKEMNDANEFERLYGADHVVRLNSRSFPHYERIVKTRWWKRYCRGKIRNQPPRCKYHNHENMAISKIAHNALFKYKDEETNHAKQIMERHKLRAGTYVAVHARVGGSLDPRKGRFQRYHDRPEYFAKLFAACVARNAHDTRQVYVASDDEQFKSLLRTELKMLHFKAISSPILAKHTLSIPTRTRNIDATHRAIVDCLILGRAKLLFSTWSSMSDMAAASGGASLILFSSCQK